MGRCAYSGERIDLNELMTDAYDVDHIYPRSKTRDDSLLRNLVLVKTEYNRQKGKSYPIRPEWRAKMLPTWRRWRRLGLITEEKFRRLSRTTPLSVQELSRYLSRQLVETCESVKALKGLIQRVYPETKVVLVRASQVSDFRHHFAATRPEFTRVRVVNDLYPAGDAYLNIVVGNVMNETFTDNPQAWLKRPENRQHTIDPEEIWLLERGERDFPKGWGYGEPVAVIAKNLKKSSMLWTRAAKALLEIDGNRMMLDAKVGKRLVCAPAVQLFLDTSSAIYAQRLSRAGDKLSTLKNYQLDAEKDQVSAAENAKFYDVLVERLAIFETMPSLGPVVGELRKGRAKFLKLSLNDQCIALVDILVGFGCNATTVDLSNFLPVDEPVGVCQLENDLTKFKSALLVRQSLTGLAEQAVDLQG